MSFGDATRVVGVEAGRVTKEVDQAFSIARELEPTRPETAQEILRGDLLT